MATFAGRNLTSLRGVNLRTDSKLEPGVIRWEAPTNNPSSVSGEYCLYVNASGALIYDNGSTQTTIGAAGTFTSTWESIFSADATMTITADSTFTIAGNRATATDVLTVTNVAGGSGSCIQITNSGTGDDIDGTSNTWGITKAGVITCTGLTLSGANTITTSSGDITWTLEDNDATALSIGASGATSMMVFVTTNGSETVTFGNNVTVSDGVTSLTSTSNTAAMLVVQNDTITTFGVGATEDEGMIIFSSDTLTTGDLLRLQLDESALNGGAFIKCVQTDAAAAKFTVAENGVTTIAGSGGSAALTITAGDVVFSDASITLTDADNAATLTVTNDTATSASVIVVAGSGVFTGSTTTSFATITPSGLTSGTGVYIPFAAITTGKGLHITSGATQTTGSLLYVQDTGANCAITSGTAASFDLTATAITGTVNKIGAGVSMTSSRTTTTGTVSDDWDLCSIVRTDIINGAGSMTAAGSVLYVENAVTNTSGTVTDTANGVEVVMDSLGTGDGVKITHSAATGKALNIVASSTTGNSAVITANSLTTGSGLLVTSSGTITNSSEGLVNIVASGATTGDALKIDMTEGTLNGGHYINCYDDTGTSSVFSIGENGVVLYSDFTEVVTAANVITAAESGSVFFLSSATEFASTLPAPQAGLHFTFIVTAAPSGANYTITTNASANIIKGTVHESSGADADSETTGADTINFVDGTAVAGDMAEVWCDGTNWFAKCFCDAAGAITIITAS
jgi:hypothetical protein